jgi:hypothetical protein
MSKRLTRIASSRLSDQELTGLLKHEIHGVLNNGKTYFGVLISFTTSQLVIQDPRRYEHTLAFTELYEIVYDANSASLIKT